MTSDRIVLCGAHGMLGTDIQLTLSDRNVVALGRRDLDVTDSQAVREAVHGAAVVINCSAYTNVDTAESDEDTAYEINAGGVLNLAKASRAAGAKLITISTDYVFDGSGNSPYLESEARRPISSYGRTKAAGEKFALQEHPDGTFIVRTAWLYGHGGNNFAQTMLNLARTKESWPVVDDQRGQPTWTRDLAEQILKLIDSDAPAGIYHGTNSGEATWFEFARAVLEEAGLDPNRITATDSSAFVRPAPRPAYSVLSHGRWEEAGISPMRRWREALHAAFGAGVFNS